jgi:hypothetical protein
MKGLLKKIKNKSPKVKNLLLKYFLLWSREANKKTTIQKKGSIKKDNILDNKKNTWLIMINFVEITISTIIIILC